MKIDLRGRSMDTFLGHFVCHLAGHAIDKLPDIRADDIDLVVTLNGVEVDALDFVKSIEEQMDRMVEQRAKDLIRERLAHVSDAAYRFEELVRAAVREALPKANWGKYGDDWSA